MPARHSHFRAAAWLAVVALLVNALLPTSLAIGALSYAQPRATAFCGAAGARGTAPTDQPGRPAAHHCALCLIPVLGPEPPPPPALAPPRTAGLVASWIGFQPSPPARARYGTAQPRGPPAV